MSSQGLAPFNHPNRRSPLEGGVASDSEEEQRPLPPNEVFNFGQHKGKRDQREVRGRFGYYFWAIVQKTA
eukprot:15269909-Alexandrium_andersonii.AAC.1